MSGTLQRIKFGEDYRDAWESAVRENPECGFMQSLTWAELQARQGVEVYPRLWLRDGQIEGGAIFQAARFCDVSGRDTGRCHSRLLRPPRHVSLRRQPPGTP